MSKTTPPRWYRDPPQPIDTGQLYADLRAMGGDHATAMRSVNYALGMTSPKPRTVDWRDIRPLDLEDFMIGAGLRPV